MATIIADGARATHDYAMEGERCRGCGRVLKEGEPVLLALVPAGYEVAYCSEECLENERRVA